MTKNRPNKPLKFEEEELNEIMATPHSIPVSEVQEKEQPAPEVSEDEINILIPKKFLNIETGKPNWNALIKSYLALEKKMSVREQNAPQNTSVQKDQEISEENQGNTNINRPSCPEEYKIQIRNNLMKVDPEVNKRLFELNFTNDQVQAIYDLAAEKVIPLIEELSLSYKTSRDLSDLEQEFGGPEQFNTVARQLSAWGEKNLDKTVFEALASNKEGIMALYKMMNTHQESPILPRIGNSPSYDSEETLRRLMQDPKYWKQQDPSFVKRIEDGFKRLYG